MFTVSDICTTAATILGGKMIKHNLAHPPVTLRLTARNTYSMDHMAAKWIIFKGNCRDIFPMSKYGAPPIPI